MKPQEGVERFEEDSSRVSIVRDIERSTPRALDPSPRSAHTERAIDLVKIGAPFFDAAGDSGLSGRDRATETLRGADTPVIDLLVGLGRRLGVDVVAQRLEAPAHLTVVRTAGCRIGQGHLFARPQPAEHTEAYLDTYQRRPA